MATEQYENEVPRNYFLKVEGYNNMILEQRRFARMQTFFSLIPQWDVKKYGIEALYNDFCAMWQLPGDKAKNKQATKKVMTPEMAKQIREAHNKHIQQNRKK